MWNPRNLYARVNSDSKSSTDETNVPATTDEKGTQLAIVAFGSANPMSEVASTMAPVMAPTTTAMADPVAQHMANIGAPPPQTQKTGTDKVKELLTSCGAVLESATPMRQDNFHGVDFKFQSEPGKNNKQLFSFKLADPGKRISIEAVESTDKPSPYIIGLRSATQLLASKILNDSLGTLEVRWNMAMRSGLKRVELCSISNGYYDESTYHSFEESGMVIQPNKYPLGLLLWGVKEYKQHEHVEAKTDDSKTTTPGIKTITVYEDEICRFPLPSVLDLLTADFALAYPTKNLSVTAEFMWLADIGGNPYGPNTIWLNWD